MDEGASSSLIDDRLVKTRMSSDADEPGPWYRSGEALAALGDEPGLLGPPKPWYKSLPWFVPGDLDAFAAVSSNNIATVLACAAIIEPVLGREIVFGRILPGFGISMVFGSVYYMVQALLYAHATGRTDICAQPFGINTPGAFAFVTAIILPAFFANGDPELTWRIAVAANFLQGAVEVAFALLGPLITRLVPMVALLTSLASIGLAFLFANTLQGMARVPLVSWLPLAIVLLGYFSKVKFGRVPTSVLAMTVGTAMSWICGYQTVAEVESQLDQVKFYAPSFPIVDIFENFSEVAPYIGLIIPVGLTVAVGSIQCVQLSANAGDTYNVRWSMLGDGFGSIIAALFGSPFGMTVFIGHPAFKEMGAKVGYNLMNAVFFFVVCFTGVAAPLLKVIDIQSLNPILVFVGLIVCSDTLEVTPPRHFPAFVLGLAPAMCNWAAQQAEAMVRLYQSKFEASVNGTFVALEVENATLYNETVLAGLQDDVVGDLTLPSFSDPSSWSDSPELYGLYLLGSNYLLTSICLTAMLMWMIDRRFLNAAAWAGTAAIFSAFGLMHAVSITVLFSADDMGWRFAASYALIAVFLLGLELAQRRGLVPAPRSDPLPGELVDVNTPKAAFKGQRPSALKGPS